jgi:phosphosulfolactate synthase
MPPGGRADQYLRDIGVLDLSPKTSIIDPGYDSVTAAAHVAQSARYMDSYKLSMSCWMLADADATERKVRAAHAASVPVVTGGGPFEIAVARNRLDDYLDLCAEVGADRIEAGAGFTDMTLDPVEVVGRAQRRGLEVQFELGRKHDGPLDRAAMDDMLAYGRSWLDAGAHFLIIEARESAQAVGLFNEQGELDTSLADRFVAEFGHESVSFEAPTKTSQFAFLRHFGCEVKLCNVRLEELLRVEIYRRGLHSDSFGVAGLDCSLEHRLVPARG